MSFVKAKMKLNYFERRMIRNPEPEIRFTEVSQHEDNESVGKESRDSEAIYTPPQTRIPWLLISALLVLCSGIAFTLGVWLGNKPLVDRDRSSINHVSNYSPLLDDIDITFKTQRFNGSLMHENIYRQTGSPEVDAAWQALGVDYRALIVPLHLAAKSGFAPSQVQVSPKYGGGYPANIEGLHHLHCLNLLRQSLYFNFDHYHALGLGAFKNGDPILRVHVTHCLDILRQQLMCNVDIGVLGQVWWNKKQPAAYPDFNTQHKCRNFEAVREWAESRQAPETPPVDYLVAPRMEDVYETMP